MGELLLASPCPEIPARPEDLNLTCREENKTQEPKIEIIRPPAIINAPPAITGMLGVRPNFTRAIICAHKKLFPKSQPARIRSLDEGTLRVR
jgi:hypothetical protein